MKKILLAVAAVAVAAPMLFLGAGVAGAAPAAPTDEGSVYFYYDSNEGGDVWVGGSQWLPDFAGQYYPQNGLDGSGQRVKNNVASVYNGLSDRAVCVYYNENYTGPSDQIGPGAWMNLVRTWNNNASYRTYYTPNGGGVVC